MKARHKRILAALPMARCDAVLVGFLNNASRAEATAVLRMLQEVVPDATLADIITALRTEATFIRNMALDDIDYADELESLAEDIRRAGFRVVTKDTA
jgi:hypothetical protein